MAASIRKPWPRPSREQTATGILLFIGTTIAAFSAFDLVFNAVTHDSILLRIVLFIALTSIGSFCARQVGLSVLPFGTSRPILLALCCSLAVAIFAAVVDSVLFRSILPKAYVEYISGTAVVARIVLYMARSFNEDLLYRLFLMSGLVWVISERFLRNKGRPIPDWIFWGAITLSQAIPIYLSTHIPTRMAWNDGPYFLYVTIRYVMPGLLWGFLYWRRGLITAQIGHACTHIFFQPLLGFILFR